MQRHRGQWLLWIPPVLWMGLIYWVSADSSSAEHTSRWIGPLVRWLFPGTAESAVGLILFGIRKCAHLTEYAILAMLLFVALRGLPLQASGERRRWDAVLALTLSVVYASTDELHQTFVPNRTGVPTDVLIDAIGAAIGVALLLLFSRRRDVQS